MKTRAWLASLSILIFAMHGTAYADRDEHRHEGKGHHKNKHRHGHGHTEVIYVPVARVEPMIEIVRVAAPRRDCSYSTTTISRGNGSATGMLLGSVIGGVIGHNLVRDRHQDVAIVAGTLLGASIGNDLSHSGHVSETQTVCHAVNDYYEEERIVGYRVTYRHYDRTYVTRTDRHPGSRIRISVTM